MSRDLKIVHFLKETFKNNAELIRQETGRSLNRELSNAALIQVLVYWQKLKHIAETVSETEVRLVLADQKTSAGTKFNIEGVVDLVQTREGTFMHDLKSIDRDTVLGDLDKFRQQLSVYAHIWKGIRETELDGAAIITTALGPRIMEKLKALLNLDGGFDDPEKVNEILKDWDPVIDVELTEERLTEFMAEFRSVVESIESGRFPTPSPEELKEPVDGTGRTFGSLICRKCDARFSCDSYRQFMGAADGKLAEVFRLYWPEDDEATEDRSVASLLYDDTGSD